MGVSDIVWLVLILGGAGYLIYRSFRKKTGPCGCNGCGCGRDVVERRNVRQSSR